MLENKLKINISFKLLILGDKNFKQNNVFSVIMYLIYKKFILDNNKIDTMSLVQFLKKELIYKSEMYNMLERTSEFFIPLTTVIQNL